MKILVLGAGGMAGSMISGYLANHHEVTSLFRKDFDPLENELPDMTNYDYVINCIGIIKQKVNASSITDEIMFKVNAEFPHKLANYCSGTRLIHISSDCVFSGKLPIWRSYSSFDTSDAEDSYGQSKSKGEPHNAMVLRTSIIGPSKDNFGLFEWFRNSNENPNKGFVNHWWSGITTLELAKIINDIISNKKYSHGLKQIAITPINKYDLLDKINTIFKLNKTVQLSQGSFVNRTLIPMIRATEIETQLIELKRYLDEIG